MADELKSNRKKIIYIGKLNDILENIINNSTTLRMTTRYENEYNLNSLINGEIHSFNGIDILIINHKAIEKSTTEDEIIKALNKIRAMEGKELKVIYIAEGFKKGSRLLSNVFDLGIYNIVTANNSQILEEELKKALSEEGISFATSRRFKLDNSAFLNVNNTSKIVEKKYIKLKELVSVGIAGTQSHIGTTTQAIMLTKFLVDSCNINSCYIEYNNHQFVETFVGDEDTTDYFENIGKICYKNIDLFMYQDNIKDIVKSDYFIVVYDYGNFQEMSEEQIASFLEKDVKFVVSGTKKWEEDSLFNVFDKVGEKADINYIFNFVPNGEKELFKKSMQGLKIYFSEYADNPFEPKNKTYFEEKFKKYINNTIIEPKKKKFAPKIDFKRLLKKGK